LTLCNEKVMVLAAALPIESHFLIKRLSKVEKIVSKDICSISAGYAYGRRIFVLTSGPGGLNAALAHEFLHTNFEVGQVITFGLAGSLNEDLSVGDIVIPTAVGLAEGGEDDDLPLDPINRRVAYGGNVTFGGLALQSSQPLGPERKRALGGRRAICVDMESHTAATIAKKHGACHSVVRVISDEMDTPLNLTNPKADTMFMAAARVAVERNAEFLYAMLAGEMNRAV